MATDTGQGPFHWLLLPVDPLLTAVLFSVAFRLRRREGRGGGWSSLSVAFLAGAAACHTVGVFALVRLENAYHTCNEERFGLPDGSGIPRLVDTEDGLLPVTSVCSWEDGVTIDLVPWFVTPAMAVFLAGAAVCGAMALTRAGRLRSASAPDAGR